MKFESSIIIDVEREKLVQLFINPDYLKHYQTGFLRKELVSGEAMQAGAISKMYYQQGKSEMELTETIVENNLPDSFHGNYHHKHMDNYLISSFEAIDEHQTRYSIQGEYTAVRGIMPRLLFLLVPGMFKKQAEKWMHNFKVFAEKH